MTAIRYSISRLGQWVQRMETRRRRKLSERIMNELPLSLQRDVGWEPMRRRVG